MGVLVQERETCWYLQAAGAASQEGAGDGFLQLLLFHKPQSP